MFCPISRMDCTDISNCAPAMHRQEILNATRDATENQAILQCPISEALECLSVLAVAVLPMLMGAEPMDAKKIDEFKDMSEREKILDGLTIDQIPGSGKQGNG